MVKRVYCSCDSDCVVVFRRILERRCMFGRDVCILDSGMSDGIVIYCGVVVIL